MWGSPVSLFAPALDAVTVADEPVITVALAKLLFTGPEGAAPACVTVTYCPAMVNVPVREVVVVLAVTDQVTVPAPVALAGGADGPVASRVAPVPCQGGIEGVPLNGA